MGELGIPRAMCLDGEVVYPGPEAHDTGPWVLDISIKGPRDGAYYTPIAVRLEFPPTYPVLPPKVTFMGIIFHMHVDHDDNQPPPLFFEKLKQDFTVQRILQGLYEFLSGPLHPCERCDAAWDQASSFSKQRLDTIQAYQSLQKHPDLFDAQCGWRHEWFHPQFLSAVKANTPQAWKALFKEEAEGVYSFPMFTADLCAKFVEEVENYQDSGLPVRRPNSMNNYGLIVNEIGMEGMIDNLQANYLQPVASYLFGDEGAQLDRHHSFMVAYQVDQDLGLDMHTDDSDVTFNVCLGKEFEGAGLQFCGAMGAADHRQHAHVYQHVKGRCVVHLGRKRHGADDITQGERRNLIIWNHSIPWRESNKYKYPPFSKEVGAPSPQCLSYTHDRDYGQFKDYPKGREDFRGRGWCPPPGKEYDSFVPDKKP
eukprot:CAMPEP_0114251380 /NCGR_PEP_ID=MMETSP0058-20121206/15239_1 /TAXON_ID=36894 /ORGANISM="Pyramimonas parkeae, CCMP726" /LENGTH=423 /DNA_ID=CAMNT_0001365177 /DNA_START=490 /DNA_END=1761 /DNA_ORIENTATION=+